LHNTTFSNSCVSIGVFDARDSTLNSDASVITTIFNKLTQDSKFTYWTLL
jgi:hypothetical protein